MSAGMWTYRALIRLLPRSVRDRHGDEMIRALTDQIAESPKSARVTWRALRRFPVVLALEWRDELFAEPNPAHTAGRGGSLVDSTSRLIRQGSRSLLRTPAFSLSVILLLGVGVGSVSAIFAVVDHVLLRRMPYESADRMFVVENGSHSMPTVKEIQSMPSVDAWAAATTNEASLTGEGPPLRVRQAIVTGGFFPMFGARAQIGRLLHASDYEHAETAVLSYGTWVRVFGGDTSVLGRTIRINDRSLTVVGVVGGEFALPEVLVDASVDVWRPTDPAEEYMTNRHHWAFSLVGRLRPGASLDQAKQEASKVATERAKAFPDIYVDDGKISTLPLADLQEATTGGVQQGLTVLFGAVTLLFLVACANVTHLFLARGVTRTREMSVRRALGANTRSLVAQLFTESLLLGVGGALVGMAIAFGGVRAFLAIMPIGLPRAGAIGVDFRVLLFAALVGIVTAAVFGLLPALRFTSAKLGDPLRNSSRSVTGGRASQALRNAIVVAEVALSLVLAAQAGWLLRSFIRMNNQELGFRSDGVVTMPMTVTGIETAAEWNVRMEAIRESIARTPGVKEVAFGLTMPLEWTGGGRCCWGQRPVFPGKPEQKRPSMYHPVSENYFELFDVPMIAGAMWTRAAASATPTPSVINEALATEVFGNANAALGATFTSDKQQFRVVGVAANNYHYGADRPYGTAVYLPATAIPYSPGRVHMAVLTDRKDGALQADLRAAVWRAEPNLPVPLIRTLDQWAYKASAQRRFDSVLFGTFSVIALLLVAGGLAGTLFYMVSLQRRNLGIRLALGATPRGLERGVLTRGVGMAAIGVIIGTVGAWLSGRFIESRLFGVEARDLRTLGFAVGVLMIIALLSSWLPARRAAGTSPMESLRAE